VGGIFISYRRGDSEGQARALATELAKYAGADSIFMDVDSIALGRDFREGLQESLESCDAALALIGPGWLDAKDAAGNGRLEDPNDYVRQEIAVALKRNIPVTPVLLQGASMPPAERLPDDLKNLAFRNGFELSHMRWHSDVREMAQRLGLAADEAAQVKPLVKGAIAFAAPSAPARLTRRRALGAAAVGVAAVGAAVSTPSIRGLLWRPNRPELRRIMFDFATVDAKGARLPDESGAAPVFTEALGSGASLGMVAISSGAFTMGSPNYEPERRPNEGPQRTVTLNRFFIGASAITQAQWAAVVTAHPAKFTHDLQPFPSHFKGQRLPVESVSWRQADEFCRRLAVITERDYRLPTEAEWEYACRAGSAAPFHCGPTITAELANYCGTGGAVCGESGGKSVASDTYDGVTYASGAYGDGPIGSFLGTTTVHGTFPPNRFGLYDMHGNVWEYCLDVASSSYADAPIDGSAYLAGAPDGERILRGGSWSHNPAICRSAYRDSIAPDNPGWLGRIGFRVVCTI
jgi:formylglycine-generating enzyme required for sulfatase activity